MLFLSLIYVTRMAILAQMTSFYLESYRRRSLMIENVLENDEFKKDKRYVETGNISEWARWSWGCGPRKDKSHKKNQKKAK